MANKPLIILFGIIWIIASNGCNHLDPNLPEDTPPNSSNTTSENISPEPIEESSFIPDGAIKEGEEINRINPPSGFGSVVSWAQAATLSPNQSSNETAKIWVDYMRLIEDPPGSGTQIIDEVNYDNIEAEPLSISEGGLYDRSPQWYNTDNHAPVFNSEIKDGILYIDVSKTPNNIVHWWGQRKKSTPNAKYYIEIRFKIEGKIGLQLGVDYWIDLSSDWNGWDQNCLGVNNCEAWYSDWFGDTEGEFITIRVPTY